MVFRDKTRENLHYYCPTSTWTGGSSPNSPTATQLHCPCCNHSFEHDHDTQLEALYSSDEFRMYRFKIQRCPSSRTSHDWTDCPYLHPGEKARRRDPRKFNYSSELCADFRKNGKCAKRDECRFAHGVFEVWLHPDRYRTELCRDGLACKRKVCFFAHSVRQLRWLSDSDSDPTSSESENSSVPVSPSDSAHRAMLSSLLSAMMADMQRTSSSQIDKYGTSQTDKYGTNCGVDTFRSSTIEVPDVKWVSDLVDF